MRAHIVKQNIRIYTKRFHKIIIHQHKSLGCCVHIPLNWISELSRRKLPFERFGGMQAAASSASGPESGTMLTHPQVRHTNYFSGWSLFWEQDTRNTGICTVTFIRSVDFASFRVRNYHAKNLLLRDYRRRCVSVPIADLAIDHPGELEGLMCPVSGRLSGHRIDVNCGPMQVLGRGWRS